MLLHPLEAQPRQRGVETGVGVAAANFVNITTVEAEIACAEGDVDPVGLAEGFDEPGGVACPRVDFVVIFNHGFDLVRPFGFAGRFEVSAGEALGGFEVIECDVCPDAEVVVCSGDGDLLAPLPFRVRQGAAKEKHPAAVVAITCKVAPDHPQPGVDKRVERGERLVVHLFLKFVLTLSYIPRLSQNKLFRTSRSGLATFSGGSSTVTLYRLEY